MPSDEQQHSRTPAKNRALLACGVVAGPVFLVVGFTQVIAREGFDLSRHYMSLLSTGDLGWLQIANFVVAGFLTTAFAVGVRRALHPGRGGTWGPLLIGAYGVGLVASGVFVTDPADGFPPGTPSGTPAEISWHSIAHGIANVAAFMCLVAACLVLARRFAVAKRRGWVVYSIATGVIAFALASFQGDGATITLALASVVGWIWITALALQLRADTAGAVTPTATSGVGP